MNIPLRVLTDAMNALEMLRGIADDDMTTEQYMKSLKAWSALHAWVNVITEATKVEVAA